MASYAARLDADPARLAAVSERRAALTALTRKYGETVEEVLAWAETSAVRLLDLDGTDERIEALRAEQRSLRAELGEVAQTLSAARAEAAARLSAEVTAELALLAMPDARVEIAVTQHDAGRRGDPPPTRQPARVGGRWLRHAATASTRSSSCWPPTPAPSRGRCTRAPRAASCPASCWPSRWRWPGPARCPRSCSTRSTPAWAARPPRSRSAGGWPSWPGTAQVLVVTHLPQVAAYADRHVLVEKASDGSVTSSGLTVLDGPARERELSRMLAGMAESDTALAHARELLEVARLRRGLSPDPAVRRVRTEPFAV